MLLDRGLLLASRHTVASVRRTFASLLDSLAQPQPFDEVLAPLAAQAVLAAYDALCSADYEPEPELLTAPAGELLKELAETAARALLFEFDLELAMQPDVLAASPTASRHYRRVADRMLAGGLADVLAEYPALAFLLGCRLQSWVRATVEVISRASRDAAALAMLLNSPGGVGHLRSVASTDADSHEGRRTMIVTFDAGKVVYKPRHLGVEQIIDEFAAAAALDLRFPRVLVRDGWGWAEHVDPAACPDGDAIERYYRRAGRLLALARVLGIGDLHAENVIAAGEHIVAVDLEVSLGSDPALGDGPADCVTDSLLLPRWETDEAGHFWDVSGLGGHRMSTCGPSVVSYDAPNSDAMRRVDRAVTLTSAAHLPHVDGEPADVSDFGAELECGYEEACAAMARHRRELELVLDRAGDIEVRHILRPTGAYTAALDRALERGRLVSLSVRSESFAAMRSTTPDAWSSVATAEIAALTRGDVPRVTALAGGRDLRCEGNVAARALGKPGVVHARRRLAALDDRDTASQRSLIAATLTARRDAHAQRVTATAADLTAPYIGRQLAMTAPARSDVRTPWLGALRDARSGTMRLEHVGPSLYDGLAGTAVMHAALARYSSNVDHRRLATLAARRALLQLGRHGPHQASRVGMGGFSGAPSVLYGVAVTAALLDQPALLDAPDALIDALAAGCSSPAAESDVLAGLAGAALALLAWHAVSPDERMRDLAHLCVNELLLRGIALPEDDAIGWPALGGQALTGMAHGACGIAVALAAADADRPDSRLRQAISRALAFEARHRLPAGGWIDLRHGAPGHDFGGWCHGAAGGGLARLALLAHGVAVDESELESSIDAASSGPLDNLTACCGVVARLELLVEAARILERPSLLATARRIARAALSNPGHTDCGHLPGFDRSLMRGLAGVAYSLLRLEHPGELPCVLLLQAPRR